MQRMYSGEGPVEAKEWFRMDAVCKARQVSLWLEGEG